MWLSGMQQSQRSAGSTPMLKAPAHRAPEEVAVGEADRLRCPGAAGAEDVGADVIGVVLAEHRHVGLGLGEEAGIVEVHHRFGRLDDRGTLGLGEARAQRQQRRADLHQRVDEDGPARGAVHGQRAIEPRRTPWA